jgi:hypothetical protein
VKSLWIGRGFLMKANPPLLGCHTIASKFNPRVPTRPTCRSAFSWTFSSLIPTSHRCTRNPLVHFSRTSNVIDYGGGLNQPMGELLRMLVFCAGTVIGRRCLGGTIYRHWSLIKKTGTNYKLGVRMTNTWPETKPEKEHMPPLAILLLGRRGRKSGARSRD